jgi:hypothetical protein
MRDRGELSLRSVMSIWLDETVVMLRRLYAEGGPQSPQMHKLIVTTREAQVLVAEYLEERTDPGHFRKALAEAQMDAAMAQRASEKAE